MMRVIDASELPTLRRQAVDVETLQAAGAIVGAVRDGGERALRELAVRLGDRTAEEPLVLGPEVLAAAFDALPGREQALLERTAGRIRRFAAAQMAALGPVCVALPGGEAGLRYQPVVRAGCYAPGGRFPLPSSVLMTAVTARAAGVEEVWVASPRPARITLAAAHAAGADALLAVGGAQAIAAFAYGAGAVPAADCIVGPGNRWVTAAKQLVSGEVRIDMLAGPSELVVFADAGADPARVAADLLAQAEHDPDALPMVVALEEHWVPALQAALMAQLETLPTRDIASEALDNGFIVLARDRAEGVALCDRLAPEHLALHVSDAAALIDELRHFGGLFVGELAAEVLGDYGAGPNHVLPTGGTARSTGALSVSTFLRVQTWMRLDEPRAAAELIRDAAELARLEGLEAHARAAEVRGG